MYSRGYYHDDRDERDYDYDNGRSSSHRPKMSEKNATIVLEEDARNKDFWSCDLGEDNTDLLQEAIDVLYNTIPGNDYQVDYKESQNSCRLIIRCKTCSKELTSYDPFITHEKGKSHKKVRQQKLTPQNPNIQAIIEKQPHNMKKGIFEPKSLESRVDESEYPILGMQFIYKEVIREKPFYTCCLCSSIKGDKVYRIGTRTMYNHLTGKTHNDVYMEVKFRNKMASDSDIKYVESYEGRIHVPVIDFTQQLTLEELNRDLKYNMKVKREIEYKPIKRERDLDGNEQVYKRIKEENRVPSPTMSPNMSPSMSPEIKFEFPVSSSAVDASTCTSDEPSPEVTLDLLKEEAERFRSRDVYEMMLEDEVSQGLILETLFNLNRQLMKTFRKNGVTMVDSRGTRINMAYECAEDMENKHIKFLHVINQDPY